MCKMSRVLNAVRNPVYGIPLTIKQYKVEYQYTYRSFAPIQNVVNFIWQEFIDSYSHPQYWLVASSTATITFLHCASPSTLAWILYVQCSYFIYEYILHKYFRNMLPKYECRSSLQKLVKMSLLKNKHTSFYFTGTGGYALGMLKNNCITSNSRRYPTFTYSWKGVMSLSVYNTS